MSESKKKTKKTKEPAKKMTDDEIDKYLKGSILIPKDQWKDLHDNSQISYFKIDGTFVKSAFIKLYFTKDNEDYIRWGTKLSGYTSDKYYKEFTIKVSNIDEIYKKIDQDAIIEYKLIKNNINESLTKYNDKIADLEEKVNVLRDENTRIIKLIKKLHGLSSLDDLRKKIKE